MHDDDLEAWDQMSPVGREWGAPDAETLWALDSLAYRLRGTDLNLVEVDREWILCWHGKELARWRVSDTNLEALRAAVVAAHDPKALSVWDFATGHVTD